MLDISVRCGKKKRECFQPEVARARTIQGTGHPPTISRRTEDRDWSVIGPRPIGDRDGTGVGFFLHFVLFKIRFSSSPYDEIFWAPF